MPSSSGRSAKPAPSCSSTSRAFSLQILAVVAALGNRRRVTRRLADPSPQALGHAVDLDAGVVDVELARDRVAGPLEQRGDRIAQRGAATVADVERARGIGGDELDVDLEPGARRSQRP